MKEIYNLLPISPERIVISNIEDYQGFLSTIKSDKYYYRGENTFYNTRKASAYRRLDSSGFTDSFINFENLLIDYYREIGQMTTDAEKENFIAFSQHHQLKTPLLDITTNPLVALYFATDCNFEAKEEDNGYIYLFAKEDCIDMSSFLRGINSKDLLNQIIEFSNMDIIKALYHGVKAIYDSNATGIGKYIYSLIDHCKCMVEQIHRHYGNEYLDGIFSEYYGLMSHLQVPSHTDGAEKYWKLLEESNNLEYTLVESVEENPILKKEFDVFVDKLNNCLFIKSRNSLIQVVEKEDCICYPVASYLFTLIIHLNYLKYKVNAHDFYNLPSLPYMLYFPTHLFDRMRAQDGLFFYQLAMHKTESTYMSGSIESQQYWPGYIIEITEKHKIKKQLASLNISRKSIFPDFDNIAIDLFEKYKEYALKK